VASDSPDLPAELRDLLERIDSFEKLEVLAHTVPQPGIAFAIAALAEVLRLPADGIESAADELAAAGFVRRGAGGTVSYVAAPGADDAAIRALVRLYEQDRLLVLRALTRSAMDRLRSSAARTFADAFLVRRPRKERDDG
jgi:hypothetical protein